MAGAFTVRSRGRGREQPLGGVRRALIAALLVLAAAGWLFTDVRMRGMDAEPGAALGSLGFYVTTWVVMMAAMMFPSIAPMVLMYARVAKTRRARGLGGSTGLFVTGYLVTWSVFGLAAYGLFELLDSADLGLLAWDRAGRYLAGGVLLAAAIYQLTPAKDACLRRCRGPLAFVLERWRDGPTGALRMGLEHGAWCVGCCWALMAALFALGVMSVAWMALVAGLIAVEKLLPWKALANRTVALTLLVLGLAIILTPAHVPGLTVPHESAAPDAMRQMH
jgi:predicted metal-binding membrane protein